MLAFLQQHKWLCILAAALLLGLLVLLNQSPPEDWSQAQRYGERLQNASLLELFGFFLIGVAATAVGLPRQLFAFICGFAFGVEIGVMLSLAMAILGCALAFFCARRFLRAYLTHRFSSVVGQLNKITKNDAIWKVLLLRFQPLGTNLLTNLAAGVSTIRAPVFLFASMIGYIPQMLVFALIGSGIRIGSTSQLLVSVILLIVSMLLGLWLLARSQQRSASASGQ